MNISNTVRAVSVAVGLIVPPVAGVLLVSGYTTLEQAIPYVIGIGLVTPTLVYLLLLWKRKQTKPKL